MARSQPTDNYACLVQYINKWAEEHESLLGAAVVGSYARGEQHSGSYIDVMLLCHQPRQLVADHAWLAGFGTVQRAVVEQWGVVQTIRAFFSSGLEVEFNFCTPSWAKIPVDPGTYRVVSDGMVVFYDPVGQLVQLKQEVKRICQTHNQKQLGKRSEHGKTDPNRNRSRGISSPA